MKRHLSILALGAMIALGGCSAFQNASAPVSTVKAQQTLDLLQAAHKPYVRFQLTYLTQPPCGLAGSPRPPFCASYAAGKAMKAADDKLTVALTTAQDAIDHLGDNPAAINAALAAAQLALAELKTITAQNGGPQ